MALLIIDAREVLDDKTIDELLAGQLKFGWIVVKHIDNEIEWE